MSLSFQIGFLASLHYIGRFIGAQVSAQVSDYLISRPNMISRPNVRRLTMSIALLAPGLGLAVMGYLTEQWGYIIAVLFVCE